MEVPNIGAAPSSVTPKETVNTDPLSFLPNQPPPKNIVNNSLDDVDLPDKPSALENKYASVKDLDPDRAAKVMDYSEKLGESPQFVDNNLDSIHRAVNAPKSSFFTELEANYPGTTEHLSQPKAIAAAHDDIPNLAAHEDLVKHATTAHGVFEAAHAGFQSSVSGLISRGEMPDITLPENASFLDRISSQIGALAGDFPAMVVGGIAGTPIGGTIGAAAGSPFALPGLAIGAGIGAVGGASAGAFALPAAIKTALIQHYKNGDIKTSQELFDRSYEILKEVTKQSVVGLATAGTGGIAGKLVSNLAPGIIKTALPVAAEIAGMTTAGAAVEGEAPTWQGLAEAAVLVGGMHAASALGGNVIGGYRQEQRTKASVNLLEALGDTSKASKYRERLPQEYRNFFDKITENGPVDVSISAERVQEYFQSKKLDPSVIMEGLGVGAKFKEALATGGDVKIPTSEFVSKLVDTPHFKALLDDVKLNFKSDTGLEDVYSVNELAKLKTDAEAKFNEAAKEVPQTPEIDSAAKIHQEIEQQLVDAGRTKSEASKSASLYEATFRTLAERTGQDAYELYKKQNLTINGPEVQGQVFNQGQRQEKPYATEFQLKSPLEQLKIRRETGKEFRDFLKEKGVHVGQDDLIRPALLEKHGAPSEMIQKLESLNKEQAQLFFQRDKSFPLHQAKLELLNKRGVSFGVEGDIGSSEFKVIAKEADGSELGSAKLTQKENGKLHVESIITKENGIGIGSEILRQAEIASGKIIDHPGEGNTSVSFQNFWDRSGRKEGRPFGNDKIALFQGGNEPRAKITFGDTGANIELLSAADKSSFLHETGHFFLNVMKDVSGQLEKLEAPTELQKGVIKDSKTILDYLGVKSWDEVSTAQHEKFAEGFEKYLEEGKAPTPELQSAFSAFKKWLTNIYKNIKDRVTFTPEVAAVLDRMLATDIELDRAQSMVSYSQEELGFYPEKVREKIQNLQAKARQVAEETLLKEQMKELTAEHKNMLKAEKEKFTLAAEESVKALPVFTAIEEIKQTREYSKNPEKFADKFLDNSLPADEAGHMETLAEQNGFASGEDLAKAIKEADFKAEVNKRVEASMAQYADMKDTNVIREKALEAIHSNKSTELLSLEHEVLNNLLSEAHTKSEISRRKQVQAKVEAAAAKEIAKTILGKKILKDAANPRTYITAERNAALRASKALIAKDFEAASKAKAEQLLNHALVAEANKNKALIEKGERVLDPYVKRGSDLKGMPLGFVRHIDNLLSTHGLANLREQDPTLITIAKEMQMVGKEPSEIVNATGYVINEANELVPEELPDFVNRVNEDYTGMELPASILNSSNRVVKDINMAEFGSVVESVKKISHVGKSLNRFLSEFGKLEMKAEAVKFAAFIKENHTAEYNKEAKLDKRYDGGIKNAVNSVLTLPDTVIPKLVNLLTLARYLDAGKENGPAVERIYRPLANAETAEILRGEKTGPEVQKILDDSFTHKEFQALKETIEFLPEIGRKLDREEMIAMALNWGTETGRERIKAGHGLTEEQVQSVINRLTQKEINFVKGMHDYFESTWHESAALEMDINGVEPKKLKSLSIQTSHGEIPGGYWPLKYEADSSVEAFKNNEKTEALYKQTSVASGQTDQGRFIERAKNVKSMVRLRLDVGFTAIDNVNHDLSFRKAIIDTRRFINQPEVKKSIIDTIDVAGFRGIEKHISRIAGESTEAVQGLDKAIQWFRYKATMSILGFKLKSFFDVFSNAVVVGNEIGFTKMPGVVADYILNPKTTKDFVTEKSPYMRSRGEFIDRDQRDVIKKFKGEQTVINSYGFMFQRLVDEFYSVPVWHNIYSENVAELGHETARNMADESVKRTFGSGGKLDVTEFQSGSEKQKILTAFGSFNMMMFNRYWLEGKLAGLEFRRENYGASIYLAARASALLFGMAGVETLWKNMIRNTQNRNAEERKKRLVGMFIGNLISPVPVVSSIVSTAVDKGISGKMGSDFQLSPLESSVTTVMKPFATALGVTANKLGIHNNAKFDKQFTEDFVKSASIMAGTPQQANTILFNYLDWLSHKNGGELTYKDLLTRRTKK